MRTSRSPPSSKLAFRTLIEVVEELTEHTMEASQRLSLGPSRTTDGYKYNERTGLGHWKANDPESTCNVDQI
jgi:hypothetical protein